MKLFDRRTALAIAPVAAPAQGWRDDKGTPIANTASMQARDGFAGSVGDWTVRDAVRTSSLSLKTSFHVH